MVAAFVIMPASPESLVAVSESLAIALTNARAASFCPFAAGVVHAPMMTVVTRPPGICEAARWPHRKV